MLQVCFDSLSSWWLITFVLFCFTHFLFLKFSTFWWSLVPQFSSLLKGLIFMKKFSFLIGKMSILAFMYHEFFLFFLSLLLIKNILLGRHLNPHLIWAKMWIFLKTHILKIPRMTISSWERGMFALVNLPRQVEACVSPNMIKPVLGKGAMRSASHQKGQIPMRFFSIYMTILTF